ncbi:MAG: hypothetical protein KAH44_07105 [Oricola sp.]|jgi:hypothetical protein|nr:hypothetical protein [Oricola sp.]
MSRSYTFDAALELKDAGLVAADAAGTIDASPKVVDLGSDTAAFSGVAIFDVSAIEIASNTELYEIIIQGSNTADFSGAKENLAAITLGATEVRGGGAADSVIGRYELPFFNEQAGVKYRYLRVYTNVTGDIATGINFTARIARANMAMPA